MTAPTTTGLFAGIGGIELGLERAGFVTSMLCEIDAGAQMVLRERFPNAKLERDVRRIGGLSKVDVLSAGFPCQDLSQAGRTAGIHGSQSGLVEEVFRLVADKRKAPRWLLLENVSFMLRLGRGAAMEYLTSRLEGLGYRWAYRIVDSRAFGVPQRRQRVILLASRTEDPRPVLFDADARELERNPDKAKAFGFYWTEGIRGLGWAVDAVPPLKGGSTIGIASPPAIWRVASGEVFTPDIRDAERLQGFPIDWTSPAGTDRRGVGRRWKLVGNAVTSGVAEWVGRSILNTRSKWPGEGVGLERGSVWPDAAWGDSTRRARVERSLFPESGRHPGVLGFLRYKGTPLSLRATIGFQGRARSSSLRFREGFLDALDEHAKRMTLPDLDLGRAG